VNAQRVHRSQAIITSTKNKAIVPNKPKTSNRPSCGKIFTKYAEPG